MIGIAVKSANCAGGDWWSEIKRIHIRPGARGQAGRVGTVLKIHALTGGSTGSAQSPLLAGVSNVE
jgi:hypothetical protein